MALFFEKRQDAHVYYHCQQLGEALELILSPNTSRDKRMEATRVCEEFKNNSANLTICGFYLYKSHPNFIAKHFGLQLIQHAVKFKWNEMSPEEKDNLKSLSLDFIRGCTSSLLDEPTYVKDAIAKFIVEIMKREWPQQWPDAIQNLSEISQQGPSQLFIVLRTFLCLGEEAIKTDGDLPPARRKEIMLTLSSILEDLFKFFVKTLRLSAEKMEEMKTQGGDIKRKEVLLETIIAESVLLTMCGYVEWVNVTLLVQDQAILLQTLCLLLQEEDLRLKAAECLETIAGRKGVLRERKPLLILLSMDAISTIFSSVRHVLENNDNDEKNTFLKRVCNILCLLGQQQLANLWGSPGCSDVDEPIHFHIYLQALITLHQQENMLTSDIINRTWGSFLKNSSISKNPTFCSFIPQILEIAKTKISRGLHPLLTSNRTLYPDTEYGTKTDKISAWTSLRASTKAIIQDITLLYPTDAFLQAAKWLLKCTNTPSTSSQVTEKSPEYFEWDSLTSFTSSVLGKLFSNNPTYIKELMTCQVRTENSTISVCELARKCMESLVEYETEALLIKNSIMTCLEPFVPFLEFYYELLLTVIQKIFSAVSYKPPDEENLKCEFKAYEYRRTAASIWIRICLAHNRLLITIIDDLSKHIQISYERDDYSSMEKSLLAEGLVVISNGYVNFEKQSKYLDQLLTTIKKTWMSTEMEHALSSPEAFISFIGLDNSNEDEKVQKQRYTLIMCIRFIHAVLKRTEPPKDPKEQMSGGFKLRLQDDPQNPGASPVLPFLSNCFHMNRVLCSIWDPSLRVKIDPKYQPALDIHESEKAAIFGIDGRSGSDEKTKDEKRKNSVDTMKAYLFRLNESCVLMLSDCSRLGEQYYNVPSLGQHLVNYVIEPWKHLPIYRLRNYIRNFLKMFCRVCPPSHYESAVIPVANAGFLLMIERLNNHWEVVRNRETVKPLFDDIEDVEEEEERTDEDNKEVIENQLVHLLTKSFLETLFAMCTMRRPSLTLDVTQITTEDLVLKPDNTDDILEELPKFLLHHPVTCKTVLLLPFIALQWPDTAAFVKAAKLCVPFIKQFVQNPPTGIAMSPEMFEQIFTLSLKGLQVRGQQIEIQSQLIRNAFVIYDTLRPLFPSLKDILLQVPNINAKELNDYDEKLFSDNDQLTEKTKKKIFKDLLSGLIGKEIGKMFAHDITILDLPAMPVVEKPSSSSLLDNADYKDLGLVKLFEPCTHSET